MFGVTLKRKHLVGRLIAAVGLMLPVLAIQPAAPAHALTLGSLAWQRDLPGTYGGGQLISGADGSATVGSCLSNGNFPTAITQIGYDSTLTGTIITGSSPTPSVCWAESAVGVDGTVYGTAEPGPGHNTQIAAFKGNNMLWAVDLPPTSCTGNISVDSVTVGANQNLYVLVSDQCVSSRQPRLVGFNPTLATGQTTPAVTLNQLMPGTITGGVPNVIMAPYNGGLVFNYDNNLRYYSYAGVAGTVWPINYGPTYNRQLSVSSGTGEMFVPLAASNPSGCLTPSMVISQIDHYDSSGVYIPHLYNLDPCSSVISIHPTPSGGVLITTRVTPSSGVFTNHIIMLDVNGSLVWDTTLPDGADTSQTDAMVDQAGQVLVWRRFNSGQQVSLNTYNAYSGALASTFSTENIAPNTTYNFYMSNIAEVGGRVYLMANKCVNGNCFPTPTLYSINMPTFLDYPRGAILSPSSQPNNYVAGGDSYSAGEGVPPFLAPTDTSTDNCHRSTAAYSTLIPTYKAWLQRFVACSGATTTELVNGKNNEPSQLQALNANTKVVTLTIGGNDVNFVQVAQTCLLSNCAPYRSQYMNNVAQVGSKLSAAYDAILAAAPNATIYVSSYPFVLPAQGCAQTDGWMQLLNSFAAGAKNGDPAATFALNQVADKVGLSDVDRYVLFNSGSVQFSDDELSLIRDFTVALDQQIQTTVASKGSRMVYVDPTVPGSPFIGHELCSPNGSYFNGLDLNIDNYQLATSYSFHPNAAGQNAYAQLIASYLP